MSAVYGLWCLVSLSLRFITLVGGVGAFEEKVFVAYFKEDFCLFLLCALRLS